MSVVFFRRRCLTSRPTVTKSRYGRPLAISVMSFGAGLSDASTALTRSLTGMEEMKSSACISVRLPSESSYTTEAILPSA